jgi:hypothetical protein
VKLIVSQLTKNFPVIKEAEVSLSCLEEPATGYCPAPDKSNPHSSNCVSLRSILMLLSNKRMFPPGLFPSGLLMKSHVDLSLHDPSVEYSSL